VDLAAFQERSFGTFPFGASRHMTAETTLTTAFGGEPNDFNSVKLFLFKVSRAAWAASKAGSAAARSRSQSAALMPTSCAMTATFASSPSANSFSLVTLSVSTPTFSMSLSASSFFCFSSTSCAASFNLRSSTCAAVDCSFWRPFSRRSILARSSIFFTFNRFSYNLICSKKDFGVV